jgi:hypothetical protein
MKGIIIVMAIGIAILIGLFSGFGGDYVGEKYNDKCVQSNSSIKHCQGNGPQAANPISVQKDNSGEIRMKSNEECGIITDMEACNSGGVCYWIEEPYVEQCRQQYRNTFTIFALIIGVITLITGFILKSNEAAGSGLVGGGILSWIIAIIAYWSELNKLSRVTLIGIVTMILVVIALKKLNNGGEGNNGNKK